ncbi:jg18237 [Pararge aegeria aegeria]|uniref:Jg18237 protein n=1 Tax=Pararge aegeria aegeria TaxID=348720 RepID=A0A8S4SDB4_9NEOP|nr:jg18237 [Pararge aegeria aegeria]
MYLNICGGRSEYSCQERFASRGCRTRRLRVYNGERVAALCVLLLPCTAIAIPSTQCGDNGQTLPLREAFSTAVDSYRLLMNVS